VQPWRFVFERLHPLGSRRWCDRFVSSGSSRVVDDENGFRVRQEVRHVFRLRWFHPLLLHPEFTHITNKPSTLLLLPFFDISEAG
jgi:hypothetical protein